MNIQFNKVILHNFGSYGHAEVDLRDKGFCLVSGRNNYKPDNALSNGSGKSFIWNGICFAITGQTIQGLSSNLKNINATDTDSYALVNFAVDGVEYTVVRSIAPKSDLKIIKNDVDVSGKGIRESEKKLAEFLPDLTQTLIASTCILGQGMPYKLSSFSPSGRKEVLENLTKSDFMIEDVKLRVANRLNELLRKQREYEDSILANNTNKNTAQNRLNGINDELSKLVKPDYASEIKKVNDLIKKINKDIDDETKAKKNKEENELEAANQELLAVTTEKAQAREAETNNYNNKRNPLVQQKTELEAEARTLKAEVTRVQSIKDVCPYCKQKLPDVHKPDTSVQEKRIAEITDLVKPIDKEIFDMDLKHSECLEQIEDQFKAKLTAATAKVNQIKADIRLLTDNINDNSQSLNHANGELSRLNYAEANFDNYKKGLEKEAADLTANINTLTGAVQLTATAKQELEVHLGIVRKMETLIKRDFRGYLLTNIISYIDSKAKEYSQIVFGTEDLNVYLDGNALDISYGGKLIDCLSGGEKQRVDLILQLAVKDMLEKYLNTRSNILVLDEITDFLDKQSCDAVMHLFETKLAGIESVFIVSHHAEELNIPVTSELHIVKNENGISEIV